MMERFLERIENSKYADNFVIKGGILVTSMVGIAMRSTMDIDTTISNLNLSEEDVKKVVTEIMMVDLRDDIIFSIENVTRIMDDMEYPGIRIMLSAQLEKMVVPLKIDISTGDVITPHAIKHQYKLMLEDCCISLWSYSLETLLAEKLQTILVRGLLNTRMRDLYDICILLSVYRTNINIQNMKDAFRATCNKRDSLYLVENGTQILNTITNDENLHRLWRSYQKKYNYAQDYNYEMVMDIIAELYQKSI